MLYYHWLEQALCAMEVHTCSGLWSRFRVLPGAVPVNWIQPEVCLNSLEWALWLTLIWDHPLEGSQLGFLCWGFFKVWSLKARHIVLSRHQHRFQGSYWGLSCTKILIIKFEEWISGIPSQVVGSMSQTYCLCTNCTYLCTFMTEGSEASVTHLTSCKLLMKNVTCCKFMRLLSQTRF